MCKACTDEKAYYLELASKFKLPHSIHRISSKATRQSENWRTPLPVDELHAFRYYLFDLESLPFIQPDTGDAAMWSDHMRLEERSIALHEEIARRLSANPELLEIARKNIARWIERDGELPPLREWKEILGRPLAEIIEVLLSSDEKARHLRQSSPFCGLLTPRERWRIYESFTVGAYCQGGR